MPEYMERSGHDTIEAQQEVRIAVVMYGGVSLAIYINGIAQELLRLVRATAPHPEKPGETYLAGSALRGSESVYRELGRIVNRPERHDRWTIYTRFVVDILSGTSAGGINAVFLAKALANDQSMDKLQQLWLDEGDLAKLLNDKDSAEAPLREQKDPASLLNSQRMYSKLLVALEGMENRERAPTTEQTPSPYASEIDLFVTTTDFHGKPVSLRLADQRISELRHRSVFTFRYQHQESKHPATGKAAVDVICNDFHAGRNPWLAFSARCTSAFPVAFEPMCVEDADAVLRLRPSQSVPFELAADVAGLRRFLPDYLDPEDDPATRAVGRMAKRRFVDGGYLDNKPFGWAIEAIGRRRTGIPVDRKLLYIEPDPADVVEPAEPPDAPDALTNGLSAFTLARYETIREDLERVLARNRDVERIISVLGNMEDDIKDWAPPEALKHEDFRKCYVTDMIQQEGPAYGGYHRLKVSLLTDDIAVFVAAAAGLDPTSDAFLALRYIVKAWRIHNYTLRQEQDKAGAPKKDGKPSEHGLLMDYDLGYRMRRLAYVIERIDCLYRLEEAALRILKRQKRPEPKAADEKSQFQGALRDLRTNLQAVLASLKDVYYTLRSRGSDNPLRPAFTGQNAMHWVTALGRIVAQGTEEDRERAATEFFEVGKLPGVPPIECGTFITETAGKLAEIIAEVCKAASDASMATLGPDNQPKGFADHARAAAREYYVNYERYDQLALPIQQSSGLLGELDMIDVFRVSPKEANLLSACGREKLAGNRMGHFGAFLDRGWRWNDIVWGRLDGAERIIAALLPGEKDRAMRIELTHQAHSAILREEFTTVTKSHKFEELVNIAAEKDARKSASVRAEFQNVINDDVALREWFLQHKPPPLAAAAAIPLLGRSSRVFGMLLDRIARPHPVASTPARWLARFGSLGATIVTIITPGKPANIIGKPALVLLCCLEALMIVLGMAFGKPAVSSLGTIALIITLAFILLLWVLADLMRERHRALWIACVVLAIIVLLLAVIGGLEVAGHVSGIV